MSYPIAKYEFNHSQVFKQRPDGSLLRVCTATNGFEVWEWLRVHAFVDTQPDVIHTLEIRKEDSNAKSTD